MTLLVSLLNGFHLSKWLKTVTVEWLISMDAVWIANKQYIRSESRSGRKRFGDYTMGNLESERLGRLRALSCCREEQAARPHPASWRGSRPTPDTTRYIAYQLVRGRSLRCWYRYKSAYVISAVIQRVLPSDPAVCGAALRRLTHSPRVWVMAARLSCCDQIEGISRDSVSCQVVVRWTCSSGIRLWRPRRRAVPRRNSSFRTELELLLKFIICSPTFGSYSCLF